MTSSSVSKYNLLKLLSPEKILTTIFVVNSFVAPIYGGIQIWGMKIGDIFFYLLLLALMYQLTAFGITVGNHRYFTHRSFKAKLWFAYILAILGCMAVQKDLLRWVGTHRRHHERSDREGDPHSPYYPYAFGPGIWPKVKAFWHAHVGWLFIDTPKEDLEQVKDLKKDPNLVLISRLFPLWVVLGILIPAIITVIFHDCSWHGFFMGSLWGGLIRIALVHHSTWSVNSVCHIWGDTNFDTGDESKDNDKAAFWTTGEGYHNGHHRFPGSACHGMLPGQSDLSWYFICLCEKLGLVSDVKVPSQAEIQAALSLKSPLRK